MEVKGQGPIPWTRTDENFLMFKIPALFKWRTGRKKNYESDGEKLMTRWETHMLAFTFDGISFDGYGWALLRYLLKIRQR